MLNKIANLALITALIVIMLGAWVRLTDAGLGCPDWPGCYGQILVPDTSNEIDGFENFLEDRPFDEGAAWREMIHRYLASFLGLLSLLILYFSWKEKKSIKLGVILVTVIMFQGMLGMLTVTWLLKPVIVMGHLLGGMTTLSILYLIRRQSAPREISNRNLVNLSWVALIAAILQLALGGWVSANYAAIACPDFPTCQNQWWPENLDFQQGFDAWHGIGIDYEGGILDNAARTAIHFTHRLGAIFVGLLLFLFGLRLRKKQETYLLGSTILAAVSLQISIGISVVVFGYPLNLAVMHNGMGALLLLTVVEAKRKITS